MNKPLPPSAILPAGQLGDGSKSASVPDFFHGVAHDLFSIGAMYRVAGVQFNRALDVCAKRDARELAHVLSDIRGKARMMDELCKQIERKLDEHHEWEDSREVYGR